MINSTNITTNNTTDTTKINSSDLFPLLVVLLLEGLAAYGLLSLYMKNRSKQPDHGAFAAYCVGAGSAIGCLSAVLMAIKNGELPVVEGAMLCIPAMAGSMTSIIGLHYAGKRLVDYCGSRRLTPRPNGLFFSTATPQANHQVAPRDSSASAQNSIASMPSSIPSVPGSLASTVSLSTNRLSMA